MSTNKKFVDTLHRHVKTVEWHLGYLCADVSIVISFQCRIYFAIEHSTRTFEEKLRKGVLNNPMEKIW